MDWRALLKGSWWAGCIAVGNDMGKGCHGAEDGKAGEGEVENGEREGGDTRHGEVEVGKAGHGEALSTDGNQRTFKILET